MECSTESIGSASFRFLTNDEVRKHSLIKITNPRLVDALNGPICGGLYDPSMGPLSDRASCKTCSQSSANCPGHCGHIELVSPVFHPMLFRFLFKVLRTTCFFCFHFRLRRYRVSKCAAQLKLIAEGDIIGAKKLDSIFSFEALHSEDSDGSDTSSCTARSDADNQRDEPSRQRDWTSLQFSEAVSAMNNLLSMKILKCENCGRANPSIQCPVFGWIYVNALSRKNLKGNEIREAKLGGSFDGGVEEITDVEDASETRRKPPRSNRKKAKQWFSISTQHKYDSSRQLLPSEVKYIFENLWKNEARFCSFITSLQQHGAGREKNGWAMFFLETILVPPIRFRPPSKGGDCVMEHPQTILLNRVLLANINLSEAYACEGRENVVKLWLALQQSIMMLFDNKTAKGLGQGDVPSGICQLLEKKEGIFRQNMMGKRVNYACRSVISPDPYLGVNEIGIPPCFAVKLTYPERVTHWNVSKLRSAVINGSETHPGATHYVDKYTSLLPQNQKIRISISRKLATLSRAPVHMEKIADCEYDGKIVHRHLRDGDIVLVNRQPTLHKPSIMAHVVRVLKGEKTLRMHYANCSTYNADFDGDEMNVHFPQDEISRAEAYNIVNANNQYVGPSNGQPVRTLIQDHIISAVLLTKKDTFLTQDEFCQLLYSSGLSSFGQTSLSAKAGQKVLSCMEDEFCIPFPAIMKPRRLWTGKQVINAILDHVTRGYPPFTSERGGKITSEFFRIHAGADKLHKGKEVTAGSKRDLRKKEDFDEDMMFIYKNYFVHGVIDKAQFGDYGFVHAVQELYGSNAAGILLSALSRLLTVYLQVHGFTCGVDDLLIKKKFDLKRKKQLDYCELASQQVHLEFVGIKEKNLKIDPLELQFDIENTICNDEVAISADLDRRIKNALNVETGSGALGNLLCDGLLKPSLKNHVSLMTTSGAKGNQVNFQQISSFLGQQDLEGKRVPRMASGKTLPSFIPWDWSARAGGYILDRFLTGLRPQEYFFHCMAGRQGLVNTAIKTSRSGYLQRCLIKNLECLKINYDHTVRDADGSIIQFNYGEDGVDVHRTSFVAKFEALARNREMVFKSCGSPFQPFNAYVSDVPESLKAATEKFSKTLCLSKRGSKELHELVRQKFYSSLAQPGEPVGVLAAQSVGEPSTQMTLDTFHLAGRGEMDVTLGIPRLQEILITTAINMKSPMMTCPLLEGKTREDADRLVDKLKKITVADIVESMEVSVNPFSIYKDVTCRIYKLKMRLYKPPHYPRFLDPAADNWEEAMRVKFVRQLEDDIQNHLLLLSKISGHCYASKTKLKNKEDEEDDAIVDLPSKAGKLGEEHSDAVEEDEDFETNEDIGLDEEKRKLQINDDVDYDDDVELEEVNEADVSKVDDDDVSADDDDDACIAVPLKDKSHEGGEKHGKSKEQGTDFIKKKKKLKQYKMPYDRAIYVAAKGTHFEIHFKFTKEPHILLSEIAQRAAEKVNILNPSKIEQCRVVDCSEKQVIYYGKDMKNRSSMKAEAKANTPALQSKGVDFKAFWAMGDKLDVRYLYANDIHAIQSTFGIEAARETIIREISHVFSSYGISVNVRHLMLIADFMTHSGHYRPLSRVGAIRESISPLSKMSFETASKFIVDAALHGEVDDLQTPSARICLGLPVRMGTGSFDLMQKLQI